MNVIKTLEKLRAAGGKTVTTGLADSVIEQFAARDPKLVQAITEAAESFADLQRSHPALLKLDEWDQVRQLQIDYVNFYAPDVVNPYVPLAARGAWIVTTKGAVLHDSGGYGMLGHGHAPADVLAAMNQPHVMANIMTASFSQLTFITALKKEVGAQRKDGCPYQRFLCMNSGSEAVTVASRISDVNAKLMTDPGGKHAGKKIKKLALSGGFHGRTDRPAQFSDSSRTNYKKYLASFRGRDDLITVASNDEAGLRQAFADADAQGVFIESLYMEPVMGEGDPGQAITPTFYKLARELTKQHSTLLLMDSIQAGLRTTGYLSITDSPGFEGLEAPDMETYSKALNAGQYPLSVLAMTEHAAGLYRTGIYGNTMTANPRALDVGTAVLDAVTPELRANIVARGKEFVDKLNVLAKELNGRITKVQGTGLLFSAELEPRYKCYGAGSTEEYLRTKGIGVIHGGKNSLRYTPHFHITSEEVDMVIAATRDALLNGPQEQAEDSKRASA